MSPLLLQLQFWIPQYEWMNLLYLFIWMNEWIYCKLFNIIQNYSICVYTSVVPVNMLQDYTLGCYYWSWWYLAPRGRQYQQQQVNNIVIFSFKWKSYERTVLMKYFRWTLCFFFLSKCASCWVKILSLLSSCYSCPCCFMSYWQNVGINHGRLETEVTDSG